MTPLDLNQLLATGALTGPHRRTRPVSLTRLQRLRRTALSLIQRFTTRRT